MKKWKLYGLVGLVVVAVVGLLSSAALGYSLYHTNKNLADANRVIDAKIEEVQEFDSKLGIAESDLRREKDLREAYEKEVKKFQRELQAKTNKIRAKDLEISSRDQTIASLRKKIKGGTSSVTVVEKKPDETGKEVVFETVVDVREVCSDKTLAYSWKDEHERFELKDPDISNSGDETFEYKQYIKITGLVLSDDSGNVKVKKITATEVLRKEDDVGNPTYEPVKDGDLVLVDSKFEYTNKEQNDKSLLDIVTLRPFASFDTAVTPGFGLELVNLGRYIDYANIGLYGKLAFDLSDPLGGSLQSSRMGVGVSYHIVPPLLPTNFAIGASLSTPFNDIGQIVFTVDIILYLTDDLSPFRWLK